jgi:DNA repair ATPase RecN
MDDGILMSLHIRGYCSLTDAEVVMRRGVTIIRGVSNEGKSSILKALNQLLYNPSGKGFINQGMGECSIVLAYGGHEVAYYKSMKDSTRYVVDGIVYDKVVGPLVQVMELLGFNHGGLTSSDRVNFWNQMALPFLLYDSPKDRYEVISSGVYNLDDVRDLMVQDNKALLRSIDETNTKLQLLEQDIDALSNKIFDDRQLREMTDKFYGTQQFYNNLQGMVTGYLDLTQQLSDVNQRLDRLQIDSLSTKLQHVGTIQQSYTDLVQRVHSYLDLTTRVSNLDIALSEVNTKLDSTAVLLEQFKVCPLCHNPINNCLEIHN